jgi:eukaryotic-like serine/threonine-protein kinase
MSTPESPDHPEVVPGQIVGGKWRVVAPIGRGGMGAVYEGQNISIGKKVALKFIDAEFARHPEIASRFQREAEAASLVESAHIVHIFDSGVTDDGIPYIVMELLRGEDLRARIRRLSRLPKEEAAHVVAQTLRGLHRAHEAGIVHRDLKPDNIFLVDRDDDPLFAKIVDFGISKMTRPRAGEVDAGTLTRQGVVLGTPFYMSPEQAQALPNLDLRTDIWSVGAILYECLAGRPPHGGDTYEQIIISICTTDAPDVRSFDSSIPTALANVVHKAMQRDRARRFQSAKEMLDALQATGIVSSISGATPPPLSAAVEAPSSGHSRETANEGGAGTRVSWTNGDQKPVVAATILNDDEARLTRARGMRRRGLIALGLTVMAAAFVLTFGLMRKDTGDARGLISATPAPASASTDDPGKSPTGGAPPSTSAGTTEPTTPHTAADIAAPIASHATPPTGGANKAFKKAATPTTAVAVTTPVPPPPVPSAAPPKAGVAGGLQIKTNYP